MKARWVGAALVVNIWFVAPAVAQSALDGPLAAPGETPSAAAPAPSHHAKPKPRKPHHAAAKPASAPGAKAADAPDAASGSPVPRPTASDAARRTTPADAVDLGMKWNGNNDTAAQTRFQNGPSNAFGSGAEVGMKLHF